MDGTTLTQIIIIVLLVIMSAYFSATETAFSSLNRTRMKTLAEKGSKRAALVCRLSEQYDKLLSTILIGNNIVNIATASIGTVLFVRIYGDIGATVSTVVITVVVLIFSEISPKSIAKDCPEKFAMFSAPMLSLLMVILTPLNFLFSQWKKMLSRLFKLQSDAKMSQEELLMLVQEVQQDGSIDKNEGELLSNAIQFTEQEAEDILTHRVDLEAIEVNSTKDEIARVFSETKFSRIPIFEENIDNIIGVIHQKDFYTGNGITDKSIREIITPTVYVLEKEKIGTILKKLQKSKSHVAVVVDEYGGTCGIVTMEDILEELVGEIWDEHDEAGEMISKKSDGVFLVDTLIEMGDFTDFFSLRISTEAVSLGGWIMEMLGQVPNVGSSFEYGGMSISVLKTDGPRASLAQIKTGAQQ